MGGAKNLKLGGNVEQGTGHRGQYFCGGQMSTFYIQLSCASKRRSFCTFNGSRI